MKSIQEYEKKEKKPKRTLPLYVYLAYLLVCTYLLTGVSFSKYVAGSNASDTARVAKGMVTVSYTDSPALEMRSENYDRDEMGACLFAFYVSNHDSEVAIGYDIVVKLDKPLQNGVWLVLDGKFGKPSATDGREYIFPNAGTFEAGEEQTQSHTLGFTAFFDSIDVGTYNHKVQISINSYQID